MSFDRLIARIDELKNPSVAGLDPKLEYVPRFLKDAFFVKDGHTLKAAAGAILAFNKALIDELCDITKCLRDETLKGRVRQAHHQGCDNLFAGRSDDAGRTDAALSWIADPPERRDTPVSDNGVRSYLHIRGLPARHLNPLCQRAREIQGQCQ